jgi:hypothetical protein
MSSRFAKERGSSGGGGRGLSTSSGSLHTHTDGGEMRCRLRWMVNRGNSADDCRRGRAIRGMDVSPIPGTGKFRRATAESYLEWSDCEKAEVLVSGAVRRRSESTTFTSQKAMRYGPRLSLIVSGVVSRQ